MRIILSFILAFSISMSGVMAQGFAYGVKGGLTLGIQKWNGYERSPLPRYNASFFLESLPEEKRFSIFGELGYHVKGSRVKSFYRVPNSTEIRRFTNDTEFRNVSLTAGVRSSYIISDVGMEAYYLLGLRGDYNIAYANDSGFLPFKDEDVNKFTYGFTFGGGLEIPVKELMGITLELSVSPDIRPQVFFPAGKYQYYTSTNSTPRDFGETKIINTVVELTIGFRFLRVVEYEE
ncbi:MAG: hypothetical protein ACPG5P_08155 [Saprospiraceae bacterium]